MHHAMDVWGSGGIDLQFLTSTLNGGESSASLLGKTILILLGTFGYFANVKLDR
jgi:hypothetical protein